MRYALDYDELLEAAGAGSVQATGVIPPMFPGANKTGVKQDLDRAKAALAASGYNSGEEVKLQFPNDNPVGGVEFTPVAERVQEQLKAAGINATLAPAPFATEGAAVRQGPGSRSRSGTGVPTTPTPRGFLPFGPGQKVGLRAGWPAAADTGIANLVTKAQNATTVDARNTAFSDYAKAMRGVRTVRAAGGPHEPGRCTKVTGIQYNRDTGRWTCGRCTPRSDPRGTDPHGSVPLPPLIRKTPTCFADPKPSPPARRGNRSARCCDSSLGGP